MSNYTNNSFPTYPNNLYTTMNLAYPQPQNPAASYYPNPYSNYSYEQIPPYIPPSLDFSNDNSFDNSKGSLLFAKSKKIINISPYNEISNTFNKSMLYPMNATDFSLRDVPENLTDQYFRERKMYKNKPDDDNLARNFVNFRKKKNSVEDEDWGMVFNQRPERFLKSLEQEKMRRKGRSLLPGYYTKTKNNWIILLGKLRKYKEKNWKKL